MKLHVIFFFFSSRRRHTRCYRDWSSDVCSSDLPGVRGTSGGGLTVLGWAYIDTGRWDEALEVAAEAASMAEANQMEIVAASADVITATVLALRGDSGAARRHADRALAAVDPAECGLVAARARRALGVAALADGS